MKDQEKTQKAVQNRDDKYRKDIIHTMNFLGGVIFSVPIACVANELKYRYEYGQSAQLLKELNQNGQQNAYAIRVEEAKMRHIHADHNELGGDEFMGGLVAGIALCWAAARFMKPIRIFQHNVAGILGDYMDSQPAPKSEKSAEAKPASPIEHKL